MMDEDKDNDENNPNGSLDYKQIQSLNNTFYTANGVSGAAAKRKNTTNVGQNLRPRRALFCLSVANPIRRACIAIVEWKPFDLFILANIFATCGVLALMNPDPAGDSSGINLKLNKAEIFFMIIFAGEALLKIIAMGFVLHPGAYLRNAWNILDFSIVLIGFVTLIFEEYIEVDVKALRAFRVLRPLRLVSGVPSLQVVLTSILKALIPLFYIALLVVFVIIIYAIIGVELFRGKFRNTCVNLLDNKIHFPEDEIRPCSTSENYGSQCPNGTICKEAWAGPESGIISFDNIGLAGLTVFTCVTLEGWTDVMYLVEDTMGNHWIWLYFVTLIIGGSFFVLNLVLGVLSGEFAKEKARQTKSGKFQKIRERHMTEEAVKGYMEWIQQAEDLDNEDADNDDQEAEFLAGGRRGTKRGSEIGVLVITQELQEALGYTSMMQTAKKAIMKFHKKARKKLRKVVKSQTFYWAVIIAVFLNSLILAVEHHNQPNYVTLFLDRANYFFLCLFTVEMLIKVYCLGIHNYKLSLFNQFDFLVVMSSLLEVAITVPTDMHPVGISVLRCIRLLRIFKVTRYWESLSNLVDSLVNSIKSIFSLLLLLFLFMIIFSLLGMQIFGGRFNFGAETPRSNFDTFFRSLLTVFQILTGEDWNTVMYIGIESWGGISSHFCIIPIIFFITLVVVGNYILLNVFLAIAVDNLADAENMTKINEEEKRRKKKEQKLKKLRKRTANLGPNLDSFEGDKPPTGSSIDTEKASEAGASLHSSLEKGDPPDDQPQASMKLQSMRLSEINLLKNIPDPMPEGRSLCLFGQCNVFRIFCYQLCTHPYFVNSVLVMICISSLLLAAEDPLKQAETRNEILEYFDYIFTGIFTVEIMVKLIAYGAFMHSGSFCRSFFNILDMFIVFVSLIAIILRNNDDMSVVRILRVVRVLRPLRAINRAKGLKHVVTCVLMAVQSIGNIMLVTVLFMFMFAVIGIQLFKGTFSYCNDLTVMNEKECRGYFIQYPKGAVSRDLSDGKKVERSWQVRQFNFDNVYEAMLTLFVVMTFEGWPGILENAIDSTAKNQGPIRDHRNHVAIYFMIYIIIIAFFMVNIFVGFVIVTFQSNDDEEEFKDCDLDKNQRKCIEYVLRVRPVSRFIPHQRFQYHIWRVVTSRMFEYMIFAFIVANTIILGAQYHGMNKPYTFVLDGFNIGFTLVFLFECLLKLIAFRLKNYFLDAWNVFDFVIVVGSILDIVITETPVLGDTAFKLNFFRLFRALRLVKLLSKGERIRTLLWTFMKSFQALPYVGLLILLLFFIYAVIGMQLFGNIRLNESGDINRYNNFQTFPQAALVLFRSSTGENWQKIMNACLDRPDVLCQNTKPESLKRCGNNFAFVYFITFNMICSFLIINLFVAIIMDNFDYLTRDWSILGPHHLEEYVRIWSEYDAEATGRMKHIDIVTMLKRIEPPLGFGKCCPHREACKRLVSMNMMMNNDGTVDFHATLFALVRTSLNIKKPDVKSNTAKENAELRSIIKILWPRTGIKLLNKVVPKPDSDERITVGKFYATFLIQEYFRRFKKKRQEERRRVHGDLSDVEEQTSKESIHRPRTNLGDDENEDDDKKEIKRRSFLGNLTQNVKRSITFGEADKKRNAFSRKSTTPAERPLLDVSLSSEDMKRHSYHGSSSYERSSHDDSSFDQVESTSTDKLSLGQRIQRLSPLPFGRRSRPNSNSNEDETTPVDVKVQPSRPSCPVPDIIVRSPKLESERGSKSTDSSHRSSDHRKPDSNKFRRPSLKLLPPSSAIDHHSDLESIASENEAESTTGRYT